MKKTGLTILLLLFFLPVLLFAQKGISGKAKDYFISAEKEFGNLRYMNAIPLYKICLKYKGTYDSLASLHIADSYWRMKNYDSAQIYYQLFGDNYHHTYSSKKNLAEIMATLRNYPAAVKLYMQLVDGDTSKNKAQHTARLNGFADVIPFVKDSLNFRVRWLKINSPQQDFSPQIFKHGLVFVSNRYIKKDSEKEFGWDGLPFSSLYRADSLTNLFMPIDTLISYSSRVDKVNFKSNDDYTVQTSNDNNIGMRNAVKTRHTGTPHPLPRFSDELDSKYNYGPICFNKNGDKIYFTRNALKPYKGKYNLEICVARFWNGSWGDIHVLPFVKPEFDYFHPALSSDETRLYFCSNQTDALGGSDIFYVSLNTDNGISAPINLDPRVNTTGNELFPTIQGDTLYFSSDGLPGIGGLDMYSTHMVNGRWKEPVNLGYPLNSSYDDFGIIYNESKSKGFFSSNRLGSDDLFAMNFEPYSIQLSGIVLSRTTLRKLDSTKVVISSVDDENPTIDSMITNLTGEFHFPVKPDAAYLIQCKRNGYSEEFLIVPNTGNEREMLLKPILLTPPQSPVRSVSVTPLPKPISPAKPKLEDIQAKLNELAKMVYFKTASAELLPEALKPLNEAAAIINEYPQITLTIEGHTDSRAPAPYNKDLSQRRANTVKQFFLNKGFSADRFSAYGYGLERPIADNSTPEGRALNRRVLIKANIKF